jgi:hypothetical protein
LTPDPEAFSVLPTVDLSGAATFRAINGLASVLHIGWGVFSVIWTSLGVCIFLDFDIYFSQDIFILFKSALFIAVSTSQWTVRKYHEYRSQEARDNMTRHVDCHSFPVFDLPEDSVHRRPLLSVSQHAGPAPRRYRGRPRVTLPYL